MGKVSNAEVERRHQLEHQRATLQDELSKTYTVRVFRGACRWCTQGFDLKCRGRGGACGIVAPSGLNHLT